MPNDYIAVVQCPILQALIRVLTVDGIHPARFLAVGELAQGVSAKAGRGIDGADIVAFRTDVAQACIAHGFGKEVINRSVLLQRIRFGGNPCDVFGQVAVLCQVNILRCFERADETERDFNVARLHSVKVKNGFVVNIHDALTGFRSVHICLCLLENACEFLLCGGTVLLGFVVQKIVIVRFQCLVLICLLLLQNCLVRSFGSSQGIVVRDLFLVSSRELVVGIARFRNRVIAGFIDIANLVDHVDNSLCIRVLALCHVGHIVQSLASVYITVIRNERVGRLLRCHLIDRAVRLLVVQEALGVGVRIAQEVGQNADAIMLESVVGLCINAKRRQRDNDLCGGFGAVIIAGFLVFSRQPFHRLIYRIFDVGICAAIRSQCLYDHCRHINVGAGEICIDAPRATADLRVKQAIDPRIACSCAGRIVVIVAGIQCNQCKCRAVVALLGNTVGAAVLLKQRFNKVINRAVGAGELRRILTERGQRQNDAGILGMLGLRTGWIELAVHRSNTFCNIAQIFVVPDGCTNVTSGFGQNRPLAIGRAERRVARLQFDVFEYIAEVLLIDRGRTEIFKRLFRIGQSGIIADQLLLRFGQVVVSGARSFDCCTILCGHSILCGEGCDQASYITDFKRRNGGNRIVQLIDLTLRQIAFLSVFQIVVGFFCGADRANVIDGRRCRQGGNRVGDDLRRFHVGNDRIAVGELLDQSFRDFCLLRRLKKIILRLCSTHIRSICQRELARRRELGNELLRICRIAVLHNGDGVAGRRVVGRLIHGGPALITNADIDHVAGRNSHNVAVCIVGVVAAVGVQISSGLEILICGGIVDARADLLTGNDQEIIGGRTAIRRSQRTAAEFQTGQRRFVVRPRTADVLTKIRGEHNADHIAGF